MKLTKGLLLAVITIMILSGCARQQRSGGPASGSPVDYAGATLAVGKGGGFAGTVREYRLLDLGELFVKEANADTFQFVKKKNPRKAKRWFARLQTMDFAKMDYHKPGNVYQYISLKMDSTTHRVTWSGGDPDMPAGVADFYNDFMKAWVGEE